MRNIELEEYQAAAVCQAAMAGSSSDYYYVYVTQTPDDLKPSVKEVLHADWPIDVLIDWVVTANLLDANAYD